MWLDMWPSMMFQRESGSSRMVSGHAENRATALRRTDLSWLRPDEPVRSQGHIHSIAPHCGWSTPELFRDPRAPRTGLVPSSRRERQDSLGSQSRYRSSEVSQRSARAYPELGLTPQLPIYEQFASNPDAVQWVSEPGLAEELWRDFEP